MSHEATLTGAPMNLLHLVRWMNENTDVEIHVLFMEDGPLRHRFDPIAEVTVLDRSFLGSTLALAQDGLVRLGSRRAWRPVATARLTPQLRHLVGFDVVYFNSATSIGIAPFLPPAGKEVLHVHELQVAVSTWQPASDRELFATRPDLWVAASNQVRDMLVEDFKIDETRVSRHYEYIDARAIRDFVPDLRAVERCRHEYRIPSDAAVVMGAGTIDWRKGADLFVQLATEVRRRTRHPVHFVWVGGDLSGIDMRRLHSDIRRSGADHVHFVGVRPDPLPWFAMADVFALTSREDPYPLVCLEQAAMGHPIVTYRNGGAVELLEGAGPSSAKGIVDHLDVGSMASVVVDLLSSERFAAQAGAELAEHVVTQHDVSVAAPALFAELEALVGGDSPAVARP